MQQVLGHDQAEQLGIIKPDFPAGPAGPGIAQVRQDTVGKEDIKCGQEGVEFIVHTKGLTPSVRPGSIKTLDSMTPSTWRAARLRTCRSSFARFHPSW